MLRALRRQRVQIEDVGLRAREEEEARHQLLIFREFVDLAAMYTTPQHCGRFFNPMMDTMATHLQSMSEDGVDAASVVVEGHSFGADLDYLNCLLSLVAIWVGHNGGEVVPVEGRGKLVQCIKALTDRDWVATVMRCGAAAESEGMCFGV